MSTVAGILRSFQSTLSNYKFPDTNRYEEKFAIERFNKKFEEPKDSNASLLADECWDNFINFDNALSLHFPLPGEWYVARKQLHAVTKYFSVHSVRFPKGSEFIPTRGNNSLQARLESSEWTTTRGSFDKFAELCYGHKGLKRAAKRRYFEWYASRGFRESFKQSNSILYKSLKGLENAEFEIFKWKLSRIVTFVEGSRFATVPKNNQKRRPINIEPFANLIYEAGIGDHIRNVILKKHYNVDLDSLQVLHRKRISSQDVATIDLQNASDSVSMELVAFLFPKWFVDIIEDARSSMVLGPDKMYYPLKKVSSMGNGFTFELMTLILTTIARVLDPHASVYGDDIIINKEHAPRLIQLLEAVGFVVNKEKSFIDGPFRESCGANYLDGYGYIESYDFLYPESIGDCITTFNKVRRLARKYESFRPLYASLYRSIPIALRGGPSFEFDNFDVIDLIGLGPWIKSSDDRIESESSVNIPDFFVTDKKTRMSQKDLVRFNHLLTDLHYDTRDFQVTVCFKLVSTQRTPAYKHLHPRNWAKYEMYLDSGRRAKDVVTGLGKWTTYLILNSGYSRVPIGNKSLLA